jgi:hypothetical protein
LLVGLAVDEMAFVVEVVVDDALYRRALELQRSGRTIRIMSEREILKLLALRRRKAVVACEPLIDGTARHIQWIMTSYAKIDEVVANLTPAQR